MKLSYIPSKDELVLTIYPVTGKSNMELGPIKLWWDDEGNIRAIAIKNYLKELEEFRRNLNIILLGGIWKSLKITEEDIRKARKELLTRLEERY